MARVESSCMLEMSGTVCGARDATSTRKKRMTLRRPAGAPTPDQDAAVESHPLDNVVWHALNTRQIQFSAGDDLARRYMVDVAPFAGMREVSPAGFASLFPLVPQGDRVAMFTIEPVQAADRFEILVAKTGHQMIAHPGCRPDTTTRFRASR